MKNVDVLLSHHFEIHFGKIPSDQIQNYELSNVGDDVILEFNYIESKGQPMNPFDLFDIENFELNYYNYEGVIVVSYLGIIKGLNFNRKGSKSDSDLLTTNVRIVIESLKEKK